MLINAEGLFEAVKCSSNKTMSCTKATPERLLDASISGVHGGPTVPSRKRRHSPFRHLCPLPLSSTWPRKGLEMLVAITKPRE